jgi:hypothetical protein
MATYPYAADLELAKLRLDLKNPRLATEPDSQRDAFKELAEAQGTKLLALCTHIAHHGLNPVQPFLVIPDDDNQFIVLDGNRRLTALRALEQPDLISDRFGESERRQLRRLASIFTPPEEVPCVVFAKRDDADVWIELQHGGESDGAGLVGWSAQQKARHKARKGPNPPHLQILDFVRMGGTLSTESARRCDNGTFPVSTLDRALTTPGVRERLGIDVIAGQVVTYYPKTEVLKGLSKLVDEIGTGGVKVGALMTVDNRLAYISSYKASELPDPTTRLESAEALSDAPDRPARQAEKQKERRRSNARTKVIPAECSIAINAARLNDIYLELKHKLRVDEVPNAAGVLLRVFVELSVDQYVESNAVPIPKNPNLANKVIAVADHLQASGTMSDKELIPVREAVKPEDKLNLATNLNALVHSRQMTVSGNDLKALWDRLQLFLVSVWT